MAGEEKKEKRTLIRKATPEAFKPEIYEKGIGGLKVLNSYGRMKEEALRNMKLLKAQNDEDEIRDLKAKLTFEASEYWLEEQRPVTFST